jgi:hypothetical protein
MIVAAYVLRVPPEDTVTLTDGEVTAFPNASLSTTL